MDAIENSGRSAGSQSKKKHKKAPPLVQRGIVKGNVPEKRSLWVAAIIPARYCKAADRFAVTTPEE